VHWERIGRAHGTKRPIAPRSREAFSTLVPSRLKGKPLGRQSEVTTMRKSDDRIGAGSTRAHLPRWMGPILFPLVHAAIPWAISLLTRREGWSGRGPGAWNLLGLPLVGVGTAFAAWGMALHMVEAPEGWEWEPSQKYLLLQGPYRLSRNPMYLGELVLWLGWALFYGSVAVLLGFCLWLVEFRFVIVPREERALEARFGEPYRAYRARVPRWLGLPRR
jgi:protein-S-isoprenylcysteine O-methyltransferase Ste14